MLIQELIECLSEQEFEIGTIELSDFYKRNKNEHVKVGIYSRESKRDDRGIAKQISIARRYLLDEIGLDNSDIREYRDNGFSGTMRTRPEYLKMLRDIRLEEINVVITTHLDRLGRESNQIIEQLYPNNEITFIYISINNRLINSQENLSIIKREGEISDNYAARCSIKSRAGIKESMRNGSVINSRALYGYEIEDDYLEGTRKFILGDEVKVENIKNIFNLYLTGKSMGEIAKIITNNGIESPSGRKNWSKSTIEFILKNPLYTGKLLQGRYKKLGYVKSGDGGKIKKTKKENWINGGTFDAIINEEIFNNVQAMIEENKATKHGSNNKKVFTGVLKCGDCGKALVYKKRSKGYKCSSSEKHGDLCSTHLVKENELIELIMPKIINKIYENNDIIDKYIKKKIKEETKVKHNEKRIENIMKEIDKCIKESVNLYTKRESVKYFDKIIEGINDKIEKLEEEKDKIKLEIENEKNISNVMIDILNNINEIIKAENWIIKLFIKKIVIYQEGKIEIEWRC